MKAVLLALLSALILMGTASVRADEEEIDKLVSLLSNSKHALSAGIIEGVQAPEVAISARFKLDDDGELTLAVCYARKGFTVGAEQNDFGELSGSPETDKWEPLAEVFIDAENLARCAERLTLMRLSTMSLLDIIKKAARDHAGMVFSITPVTVGRKAQFLVLMADRDKIIELRYDLMTGERVKPGL